MDNDFIDNLKWQYSSFPTQDLVSIWEERNQEESNYIEETFEAIRQILAERDSLPAETEKRSPTQDHQARSEDVREEAFSFSCVSCARSLRICLPINPGCYSCPTCRARYQPVRIHNEPYVILLVPGPQDDGPNEPRTAKTECTIPQEIKDALSVFGLTEFASFQEAKQAYRNTVKQYHPDKVAHLGPELKVLAETKTKEFIVAYEKIKNFFGIANE